MGNGKESMKNRVTIHVYKNNFIQGYYKLKILIEVMTIDLKAVILEFKKGKMKPRVFYRNQ